MLVDHKSGNVLAFGSMVFFGFRFSLEDKKTKFDFDNYLLNEEDAEIEYGCSVHVIDFHKREYCVALTRSCSIAIPEKKYKSKKFSFTDISKSDIEHLWSFCRFFGIPFVKPEWRHAAIVVPVKHKLENQIHKAERAK